MFMQTVSKSERFCPAFDFAKSQIWYRLSKKYEPNLWFGYFKSLHLSFAIFCTPHMPALCLITLKFWYSESHTQKVIRNIDSKKILLVFWKNECILLGLKRVSLEEKSAIYFYKKFGIKRVSLEKNCCFASTTVWAKKSEFGEKKLNLYE